MNDLYFACKTQDLQSLSILLSVENINLAIVENEQEEGCLDTPLLYAIKYGKSLLLDFILSNFSQEINFNAQDVNGSTPLCLSIQKNRFDIFEILIRYGANVTIQNNKQKDAIDYLVDKYFDIHNKRLLCNSLSLSNSTSTQIDDEVNHVADYILYNDNKHKVNKYVLEIISKMIKNGSLNNVISSYILYKIVYKLISVYKHKSMSVHNSEYFFKLRQFNLSDNYKFINILAKSKLDINAYIDILDINSPFMFTLIASDIRPNIWIKKANQQKILFNKNEHEQNVLMYACINNRSTSVNKLIPYFKRKINDLDINGCTALHLSLGNNNYSSSQALLFKQSDVNIRNKDGVSSLDVLNSMPTTLHHLLIRDFQNINVDDLIENYLAEFIDCFYYNPKLNIDLYKLILANPKLRIENKILLHNIYMKVYINDKYNLFAKDFLWNAYRPLEEGIVGQYGFESECSRLYWQPVSYIYKIENIIHRVFGMELDQDLAVDVPNDHIKMEMKTKIIRRNRDMQGLFCTQQFLQLQGVTKRGGDDHIHMGISQFDAGKYGLSINNKLFHVEIVKRILIYFIRYWDIFAKVAHGDKQYDHIPFQENINSRLDFIDRMYAAQNMQDVMNIIQNKDKKLNQRYRQRYTIFNFMPYTEMGTFEIRCFTLKGYAKQVVEGYGNIHGIKLCDNILKQALSDVVNLYNNNVELSSKNENVKNAFLEYESNILKYNKYFKDLQLQKTKQKYK